MSLLRLAVDTTAALLNSLSTGALDGSSVLYDVNFLSDWPGEPPLLVQIRKELKTGPRWKVPHSEEPPSQQLGGFP